MSSTRRVSVLTYPAEYVHVCASSPCASPNTSSPLLCLLPAPEADSTHPPAGPLVRASGGEQREAPAEHSAGGVSGATLLGGPAPPAQLSWGAAADSAPSPADPEVAAPSHCAQCWGSRTLCGLLTPAQTFENSPVFDVPARTYRNRQRSTCYMQGVHFEDVCGLTST